MFCSLNMAKLGYEPGVQLTMSVIFTLLVFCKVFPWVYCAAGVFMVQQVLLAAMPCSKGGRVSWPIYKGKNPSHMAPVMLASGKSI